MLARMLGQSILFGTLQGGNFVILVIACIATALAMSIGGGFIYWDSWMLSGGFWLTTFMTLGGGAVWAARLRYEAWDTVVAAEEEATLFGHPHTRAGRIARVEGGVDKLWPDTPDPDHPVTWTRNTHTGTTVTMVACVFLILFQFGFAAFGLTPWVVAALFMFVWSFGLFGDLTVRYFLVDPHHVDGTKKRSMIQVGLNIASGLMAINATGFVAPLAIILVVDRVTEVCVQIEAERTYMEAQWRKTHAKGSYCRDVNDSNCRASENLCR